MADTLGAYRRKRDFAATPEPRGRRGRGGSAPLYVIHEHDATSLHWDLRLEHGGVLLSWALPKCLPAHPKENRLAVRTEDHPLEYGGFEGEIPEREYGAGSVRIWDRGTFELEKLRDDELIAVIHGERVEGRYALIRTRGKNWLIHRMDPPQDPGYEPMPERIAPMLACLGGLPPDEAAWGFEVKWDGVRALLFSDAGHVRLQGRSFADFTQRYPELRRLGRELGPRRLVLDGEIVALGDDGRPSFERLQTRMHLSSESAARRRAGNTPVTYMAFDLLWLDGHSACSLAYEERRRLLESLELAGASWRTPAYRRGEGRVLLDATAELGVEGVVAKRLDSPYEPGRRSRAWVKVKNVNELEVVIGGWTRRAGTRGGRVGALAIGVPDDGALRYIGRVGTGFSEETLGRLARELEPLRRERSPFEGRQPPKATLFVEPRLVATVEFREWTRSGTLRAPSFKGLRPQAGAR